MPAVVVGPFEGLGVLGAGTAFPPESYDNARALGCLPPEAHRGRTPDAEELAFLAAGATEQMGVVHRAWSHRVGTALDPANEPSSFDLGLAAARAALAQAGVPASALSLVVTATSTPHRMTSTLAAPLGAALGAQAACFDVRTGCAAGLFGLATVGALQASGAGPAVLVGAETFSKIVPPVSKAAALSLGDGGGALVLGKVAGAAVLSVSLETDGNLAGLVTTDGALPPTPGELARGGYLLTGSAEQLRAEVLPRYQKAIEGALRHAGLTAKDIDAFVPHQTSVALIEEVCARVGLERSKAFVNVPRHANVGAAGWLVALAEARAEGKVHPGMRVLLAAVGGGMSWAAAVLRT
ncbi:MAG: hypothetical protein K1X89_28635 [Myxococcaceae bacterium]|nr:hypothetical protein [Myxococcaceae bacterium]